MGVPVKLQFMSKCLFIGANLSITTEENKVKNFRKNLQVQTCLGAIAWHTHKYKLHTHDITGSMAGMASSINTAATKTTV